jgi:hypothetical protein
MNLLKGRAAVSLQLSLPLLPDLEGNEFIMSQLLSLEEFPFGRRFWCLGWVWPQMTSTLTLSPNQQPIVTRCGQCTVGKTLSRISLVPMCCGM